MKTKYNFLSYKEPTDKELNNLMKEVLKDVKLRSEMASKKFKILQQTQIIEARERFKNRILLDE